MMMRTVTGKKIILLKKTMMMMMRKEIKGSPPEIISRFKGALPE